MTELNALRDLLRSTRFRIEGMRHSETPTTRSSHRRNMLAASVTALALLTGCIHMPTISSKDKVPSKEELVSSADQYKTQQMICVGDECQQPFFKKKVVQVPTIPRPALGQAVPSDQKPQAKCPNNTTKPLYDSSLDTSANASPEAPLQPKIISPTEFVEEWARRWSARDVEGYFSSYVADFKPSQGISLAKWRAKREQKMERSSRITITLKNMEVEQFGNRATVRFVQDYDSPTYRYRLRKSLELVREDGHWKIQKERVIRGKV